MSEGFILLGKHALVADYLCAGLAPQEKAMWHDLPQKAVRQLRTIALNTHKRIVEDGL